jgi:hypothetical protein
VTVRFEVAFISGYSLVLLGAAWGLRRLGHVNNDPWSSRLFAAYRREVREAPRTTAVDWPHSEAPRLYTCLGLVAAAAATLLCVAEGIRSHAPAELGVLTFVGALGLATIRRLARSLAPRR